MIGKIDEYRKFYWIAGFSSVKVSDLESLIKKLRDEEIKAVVQVFNADLIAGWEHLFFAALNAFNAFESSRNVSRRLEMEILLYASARRQIEEALKLIGIKPSVKDIAVIILSDSEEDLLSCSRYVEKFFGGERNDAILSIDSRKFDLIKNAFKITEDEIEAVGGSRSSEETIKYLIIEHMALLNIQK